MKNRAYELYVEGCKLCFKYKTGSFEEATLAAAHCGEIVDLKGDNLSKKEKRKFDRFRKMLGY